MKWRRKLKLPRSGIEVVRAVVGSGRGWNRGRRDCGVACGAASVQRPNRRGRIRRAGPHVFPPGLEFARPWRMSRRGARQVKIDAGDGILKEPLFMQFAIPLSRGGEPLFRQVYRGIRQAILSGSISPGERLPSTRDLAEQLGISRTVVLLAYEHLLAEGFITGRGGSGTYVSQGMARNVAEGGRRLARLRLSRFGNAVSGSWRRGYSAAAASGAAIQLHLRPQRSGHIPIRGVAAITAAPSA